MATLTQSPEQIDAIFSALSNQRRRYALHCLEAFEQPVAIADLAREVLAREEGTAVAEVADEKTKRVNRSLYHVHIPKLEEADLVRYDTAQRAVTLSEGIGQLTQRWDRLSVEYSGTRESSSA